MLSVKAGRKKGPRLGRIGLAAVAGAGVLGLVLGTAPAGDPSSQSFSREEITDLADSFNRWAAGLRTLRVGGKARVGAEGEKTRVFNFSLALARPGAARLQGRWGALATLFDLSGDAAGWTLYLPQERAVVRADSSSRAGLLLPPFEIISVLLPAGIPPRDLLDRGAATREEEGVRLVVPPGKGGAGSAYHRVLWVEPETGVPLRLEIRRRLQLEVPILVASYEEYEGKGFQAFPVEVRVDLVEDGQWARFDFETVRINTDVGMEVFQIHVPEGTREMAPEELTADFLPEDNEDR
jgi:hypothetical protein